MYLGLPIGGDTRKLCLWYPIVDCVKSRLFGWKSYDLSMGGRLVLMKSVLSSIPVYFLSFFKAPSDIISILESIFNDIFLFFFFFFWGGRIIEKSLGLNGILFVRKNKRVVWGCGG